MAIMMGRLYAALRAGDVPEPAAREAAEEVAGFENRLSDVTATQRLHTWILTFNTAMLVALVARVFLSH